MKSWLFDKKSKSQDFIQHKLLDSDGLHKWGQVTNDSCCQFTVRLMYIKEKAISIITVLNRAVQAKPKWFYKKIGTWMKGGTTKPKQGFYMSQIIH